MTLNRLITQKDEQNAIVTLTRNGVDDVTAYKDPRTITTSYVRNGFGEAIREVSPDAGTTTYVRDLRGLITQRTDPRGIVTNFTYDNAGRPLTKSYVGRTAENVTLTWDQAASGSYPIGRPTTIADQSGTTKRRYDAQGRMWGEWRTISTAPELYTWWGRDASGQINQAVYPSGRTVVWNRDAMGRVSQIATRKDGASAWVDIANPVAWHPWGGVKSLAFANGLTASFDVDKDYRISAVKVLPSSGTGVLNRGLIWTGDTLDTITDALDATRSETFGYSATRRLTSATGKYGTMGWSYDAVGNRASEVSGGTTKTYTTPATSNRLSSVTQGTTTLRSFGYDAAGAIATDAKAGVTWTSTYDAEGRVVQAQSGTFTVGTYVYDAESKLAKRTASNVTPAVVTHYLYDPDGHVIAETTSAGVTMREYIWLGDMPVAVIDAVNTATPVTYFVHTDHLMRPLKMTNAMQAVAWDAVWKPFGETFSITSAPKLDLGFPGQWTQSENGLAWNWHRHYDPTTGRYTKPDPLRFVDGPGVYAYVGGSPLTKTDSSGLAAGKFTPMSGPITPAPPKLCALDPYRGCYDLYDSTMNTCNSIRNNGNVRKYHACLAAAKRNLLLCLQG